VNKKFAETDYAVRIKTEADILISLNHPNIIGFRGFSKTEDGREVQLYEFIHCLK
jgi:serine/threonine protein kinase